MKQIKTKKTLLLALLFCCINMFAQVPTAGLLGYYPFNGNANDLSGNTLNGVVNGASLTADRFGNLNSAYSFNGSSNYIDLPASAFTNLNIYTYSCWIKPAAASTGFAMCFGESAWGVCQTLAYQSTGSITAGAYNQGSNPTQSLIHSAATYSLNQWLHIAMTRDLTSIKLYVNGVLQPGNPIPGTGGQNADYGTNFPIRAFIGARTLMNSYFNGLIDDVRIYSNALTQSDITALYNEVCFQSVSPSSAICSGNTATISAIPGASATVSWYTSLTSTNSIGSGTLFTTPSLATAGTYTYYASSSSCSLPAQWIPVTVSVNPSPTISVPGGSICSGGLFGISPTGAYSYTYSNGNTVSPNVTTTYTVIGSSFYGCLSNVATVTVTVNQSPTITVNSGFVCNGDSFTLSPTGGTSYTYSGGSAIVTPTANTIYTVTGTTGNGCYGNAFANVGVVASPTLIVSSSGNICAGGSATLNVSGANFYTWSTGATATSLAVNPASTTVYTVSGVNLFGCLTSKTITLTVNPLPTITVNSGSICSGKSFTIIPGGASTYTYSGGSNIVSPLSNTSYSVTGTSAQGCISSNTAVSAVTVIALPVISVNSGTTCAGTPFVIAPSGGTSYTYSGGSATVSPLTTTNYTVTGAANGCTATSISSVSVIALPAVTITGSASICNGNSATLTANGAVSYSWNTGATTSTLSVSPGSNTTYTAYGFNASGCKNSAVRIVTVNAIPVVSVTSGSVCAGSSFTMVASGASSYTYSGGSNIVSPSGNSTYSVTGTSAQGCVASNTAVSSVTVVATPTISVNSGTICAGTSFTITPSGGMSYTYSGGSSVVAPVTTTQYTVSGANSSGCRSTAVSTVNVNALPVVSISGPAAICNGASATFTANGASSYTWNTSATTQTILISPVSTTAYSVIGLAANGCSSSATKNLTVNPLPFITVNSGSICAGSSFTIVPTGASTYTYSGGTNIVSPASDNTYSVTGTSAQGCIASNTAVASVNVVSLALVSVNSGSLCAGEIFTMIPSGAISYTYSNGSSTVIPTGNTSYTVRGSNAQGCVSAPAIANVTVVALPLVSVNSGSICTGSSFTITPSGAVSYTITGGAFVVNPASTTPYTVTGSNAQGCVSLPVISQVTVNSVPVVSVNSGTVCAGGIFTMNPSGAATYIYSNGSNTVIPSANTNYTVTGVSAQGCPSSNAAISSVTVIALPVINVNSGTICAGASFVMNPTGAATYTFSNGSSVDVPAANTSYTITGTSAAGCISNPVVSNVTVNAVPSITLSGDAVICTGETTTLSASGATSYTWSTGALTHSILVSVASNTIFTVTGANVFGCTNSVFQSVAVNTVPVVSAPNGAVCLGDSYVIIPSGATSYTFSGGSATVSPSGTTVYTVIGSNQAGCLSSNVASLTVVVNPLPAILISGTGTICNGASSMLSASGGTAYLWDNGTTGANYIVTPSVTTTYSVSGTNINGCTNTATKTIFVNALPTITVNSGAVCPGNSFTFTPSGASTYSYSSGSDIVSPVTSNTYAIIGTDNNGCVSAAVVSTVNVVNTLTVTVTGNTLVCSGDPAFLVANGASSYSWSSGALTNTISPAPASTTNYTVVGTSGTCSDVAVISVSVNPSPTITINSGSVCPGDPFVLIPAGALSYTFSSNSPTVTPASTMNYTVLGTDANGCVSGNTSTVTVLPLPSLLITSTSPGTICLGENAVLTVAGAQTYSWNFGATSGAVSITPAASTSYTVTGVDANGCKSQTSYMQQVELCDGLLTLAVSSSQLNIYPNPNTGSFFVEYPHSSGISIIVEDLEGKRLYAVETTDAADSVHIKNPGLKPGVYFCKIIAGGNTLAVKKLIITN